MANYLKDPEAVLDYAIEWEAWLTGAETITESEWIPDSGITLGNGSNGASAPSISGTRTIVWLIGGTAGRVYRVTNRITTSAGRTDDRSLVISVVHK